MSSEAVIQHNIEQVRRRIAEAELRYGRVPGSVTLLAVSKTRPAEDLLAAVHSGQQCFGESYLQEALDKVATLAGQGLEWHFIGPIQSNKTRPIAESFHWVHSVERLKIARRLSEQRPDSLPALNICLQVNIDGEASKAGCTLEELPALATEVVALPRLRLRGLMAIPRRRDSLEQQREPFRRLRQALEQLQAQGFELDTLSMGMSGDLEAAVAEGATMVRIGTDIFGARDYSR
jgi:pyridoxal phosphate enzyme (YggS family)